MKPDHPPSHKHGKVFDLNRLGPYFGVEERFERTGWLGVLVAALSPF